MKSLPRKQKGVAIITALLIVAIATAISADISTDLQLDVRRTSNMIFNEQFLQYNLAAEKLAANVLYEDRQNNNHDDLVEPWAMEEGYAFPFEGGTIAGRLTDLHRCININSLYQNGNVDAGTLTKLQKLLVSLDLDVSLSQSILDWIDGDQNTRTGGAEDLYYTSLEHPYRAANSAMQSASELRLVKGFEDSESYNRLVPFVCAFGPPATVNVNTAPAEVLSSLGDNINSQDIIEEREKREGFTDINDFLSFGDLRKAIKDPSGLSTSSEYFLLETVFVHEQVRVRTTMYSILHRNNSGEVKVIARSQGVF